MNTRHLRYYFFYALQFAIPIIYLTFMWLDIDHHYFGRWGPLIVCLYALLMWVPRLRWRSELRKKGYSWISLKDALRVRRVVGNNPRLIIPHDDIVLIPSFVEGSTESVIQLHEQKLCTMQLPQTGTYFRFNTISYNLLCAGCVLIPMAVMYRIDGSAVLSDSSLFGSIVMAILCAIAFYLVPLLTTKEHLCKNGYDWVTFHDCAEFLRAFGMRKIPMKPYSEIVKDPRFRPGSFQSVIELHKEID